MATRASPSMRFAPPGASHMFLSPDKTGQMTIYQTSGNPYGHIIMRGGKKPNYYAEDIAAACDTRTNLPA